MGVTPHDRLTALALMRLAVGELREGAAQVMTGTPQQDAAGLNQIHQRGDVSKGGRGQHASQSTTRTAQAQHE